MTQLIPLFAAIFPFVLWPIELFFPYPYLVEEIAKAGLVVLILKHGRKTTRVNLGIISGFLFALSESVLIIFNISLSGDIGTLLSRFLLTIPLHTLTILIMLVLARKNRKLLLLGLLLSIAIHFIFNEAVSAAILRTL